MSKKSPSKRLEHIFDDLEKEEFRPPQQLKRLPAGTGFLTLPKGPLARPRTQKPKSITPRAGEAPGTLADTTGTMSLAFRTDENSWATLRVVDETASHAWAQEEQMLVKQVADQLSLALENARLFQETKRAEEALKRQNEYLAAAAEIGRLVTSTLDLNTIFSRTVNLVRERFGYYHAAIFVVEEGGFNVILREATGSAGAEMKARQHSLLINESSIVGKVALRGEPVVANDTAHDPAHKPNPLLPGTRAEAAIPLRVGSRIIGALDIQSTDVNAFTPDSLGVLQILADQVAIAIDNARSYELSQEAVKEMREIDRVKTQFLANMSHELRTPLNSIIGFSRVILKGIDGPITELQQQDLSAIYNSGQHLLGLINDVLDLAKIEAGKMELSFDDINITDIINSVMSTATGLVKDKPIKLLRQIDGELPVVRGDAIRLRQVLLNLLSNAAKFTDVGEIIVHASVQNGPAGRPELLVSVSDTGPGILSGGRLTYPQDGRHRSWPVHQPAAHPTAWRPHRCAQRGRQGQHLLLHASPVPRRGGKARASRRQAGPRRGRRPAGPCSL
jgi:GAF domain-containing protein